MEAILSLSIITIIGLALLKLSMNVLAPRQSILQQTLVDAYITYERAYAERMPFEELTSSDSPFPAFPDTRATDVEIGRLQGGTPVIATVTRTRFPDENNLPAQGGSGTEASNPASLEIWRVQSVLTYKIGDRSYMKARTVIRSQ